jgi:predicted nucleic acid-binding protein
MHKYTALLDANVLYPAITRDILVELARTGLYQARWTADIHREWIEALIRKQGRDRTRLEGTRDIMNRIIKDSLISGYEQIIPALDLPDPDDRHVLAAAIAGRCDLIITFNLTDFPPTTLAAYAIEARHPDDFLSDCLEQSPAIFGAAIRKVRDRLKQPAFTVAQYLANMSQQKLGHTATKLAQLTELI